MTKKRLKAFSEFLEQHQGPYLTDLSRAMEPVLMALVDGRLSISDPFPIEVIDSESLQRLPKGCIVEYISQKQQRRMYMSHTDIALVVAEGMCY